MSPASAATASESSTTTVPEEDAESPREEVKTHVMITNYSKRFRFMKCSACIFEQTDLLRRGRKSMFILLESR